MLARFLLLGVLLALVPTPTLCDQDVGVGRDGSGNLVLRPAEGGVVLVDSVDILDAFRLMQSEIAGLRSNVVTLRSDKEALQRTVEMLTIGSPFDKLYALGGEGIPPTVEFFTGTSWAVSMTLEASRQQRTGSCFAAFGRLLYMIGGIAQGGALSSAVDTFNGYQWQAAPSLPVALDDTRAVEFQGALWIVGGRNTTSNALASTLITDGALFANGPSMIAKRRRHGLVSHNGMLYALGGLLDGSINLISATVERCAGTNWITTSPMSTGRYSFGAASFQNMIYVAGGIVTSTGASSSVEVFDGVSWKAAPQLSGRRSDFGMAVFKDLIYVVNGRRDPVTLSSCEQFNGLTWASCPSATAPRSNVMAVWFA